MKQLKIRLPCLQIKVVFGELVISNAWIRNTPANHHMTAGYLKIANVGNIDDKLIDVSSSIAEKVEIHLRLETLLRPWFVGTWANYFALYCHPTDCQYIICLLH